MENQLNKYEKKALYLVRIMNNNLALRFVNAKIEHWKDNEFIDVRTETKEYWESVKSYIK